MVMRTGWLRFTILAVYFCLAMLLIFVLSRHWLLRAQRVRLTYAHAVLFVQNCCAGSKVGAYCIYLTLKSGVGKKVVLASVLHPLANRIRDAGKSRARC